LIFLRSDDGSDFADYVGRHDSTTAEAEFKFAAGRSGRALEAALAALTAQGEDDGTRTGASRPTRAKLVQDASDALWCFIVQREAIGLRDPRPVIRDYRVPAEVQNRMGAFGQR